MSDPRPRRIINLATIASATGTARDAIGIALRRAEVFSADPERAERHSACLCPPCHYISRAACVTYHEVQCGLCDAVLRCRIGDEDALCPACARRVGLCRHCGGDIDAKVRRRHPELATHGASEALWP